MASVSDVNKDQDSYSSYDEEPYEDSYDDAYAAGAAGAAGGAEIEAAEDSEEGSGIPLRGLAMVLVAVAILLAIWGVWALVGGSDDDSSSNSEASTEASAPMTQPAVPNAPAQQGQQPAVTGAPQQVPTEQRPNEVNGVVGDNQATTPAAPAPNDPAAAPSAAAPASGEAARPAGDNAAANTAANNADNANGANNANNAQAGRVNVLNNSTVQDLAANTSRQLEGQGNQIGQVGNLPEEQYKVDETTVFYQPGGEERARRLAEQLGGVARPYDPNLPDNTAGQGDLTVVLAGAVAAPTR
ncbi:hypothetical protein Clow_01515 [Corynebacterium lowii]|uniref:LytR/CpsA/Psr regulator C-terminal domain-containing protein n=1 Tax=Corynebacterium lowii TaxID=1544413 RepID=A0A0Q0YV14_9CORY|nr:hypothetical protein Clow_01515 [Corynebacterium lowii]